MSADSRGALIGLDWGTSSLRAFLFDAQGQVIDARASAHGILQLPAPGGSDGFRRAFAEIAGGWLARHPDLPAVASGMVGSKQGWREAPYVRCPADVMSLATHAIRVDTGLGTKLVLAPGVVQSGKGRDPDVMRGEEVQIAGALAMHPGWTTHVRFVLPGTHSKWVEVREGRIESFATFMTGELFALLLQHSILGRMTTDDPAATEAREETFRRGVRAARAHGTGDLTHQLFVIRALGLTDQLAPELSGEYLSGLLIGHELAAMNDAVHTDSQVGTPVVLIGEDALTSRYALAAAEFGMNLGERLDNTAPAGLWQFALCAALLPAASR